MLTRDDGTGDLSSDSSSDSGGEEGELVFEKLARTRATTSKYSSIWIFYCISWNNLLGL